MRFSGFLAKAPSAPFKRSGKTFDSLFVAPQREKKAWDGQDKDAFFRDKYAHVHAKQLKRREEEQERKRLKTKSSGTQEKVVPQPKPDFARRFADRLANNRKLEYIYGTNAVRAVLHSRKCYKLFTGAASVYDMDQEILALCRASEVSIETQVPNQHLQIMAANGVHNKYIVETEKPAPNRVDSLQFVDGKLLVNGVRLSTAFNESDTEQKELRSFKPPVGLFIDQVTDTHNMGALLRSAHFFGVDFVAISARNSAPMSPAVVKASSGAAEFVPVLECAHTLKLFDEMRAGGWAIVATGPSERALRQIENKLTEVKPNELRNLSAPTLLVVGSEGDGIRTSLLQRSTHQTTLHTRQSQTNSLNVSVAGAVLLHAITAP